MYNNLQHAPLKSYEKVAISGFTLLELMIVISIIGILSIVAIPNYFSYKSKAICSATEQDARKLINQLADYFGTPAHTTIITPVSIIGNQVNRTPSTINGITYPLLYGSNTAQISRSSDGYQIVIFNNEPHCSEKYQDASPNWNNNVYTKIY